MANEANNGSTLANQATPLPGKTLSTEKMPGHWLLARLGKRVLRPGGREMTERLVRDLNIGADQDIVELAPGLGLTAMLLLSYQPGSYTAIEKDADAAAIVRERLAGYQHASVNTGQADRTGLKEGCADVVLGEAILTLQTPQQKTAIASEVYRLLRPGGRYALHELALVPDDLSETVKKDVESALCETIHVGARPLTPGKWCSMLEEAGFSVIQTACVPMGLLNVRRVVADEGLARAVRILFNLIRDGVARRRVFKMRRVFKRHAPHLRAISIIARK